MQADRLAEWLPEWMLGWRVDWVSGRRADWLPEGMLGWWGDWLVGWMVEWLPAWMVGWRVGSQRQPTASKAHLALRVLPEQIRAPANPEAAQSLPARTKSNP